MIGDFNGWGGDQVMTWDATNHVFTGTIDAAAAGAFKFRANGAWTINLGGDLNALTAGGDNIPISLLQEIIQSPWIHGDLKQLLLRTRKIPNPNRIQ